MATHKDRSDLDSSLKLRFFSLEVVDSARLRILDMFINDFDSS